MAHNILNNINDYFTEEFKNAINVNLDESKPGVEKAIAALIPSALVALSAKVRSGNHNIFNEARNAAFYYPKSPDVAQLINDEAGSNLPYEIFGKEEDGVARHVAAYSGLRPNSVFSLMLVVLPVVMGKLGEHVVSENLSANDFSSALSSMRADVNQMTPQGYSLREIENAAMPTKEDSAKIHENAVTRRSNFVIPRWVPFVCIALVVLLLVYFSRQ